MLARMKLLYNTLDQYYTPTIPHTASFHVVLHTITKLHASNARAAYPEERRTRVHRLGYVVFKTIGKILASSALAAYPEERRTRVHRLVYVERKTIGKLLASNASAAFPEERRSRDYRLGYVVFSLLLFSLVLLDYY